MTKLNLSVVQPIRLVVNKIGASDMNQAIYDPQGIHADAFSADNHTDGVTKVVMTVAERAKLAAAAPGTYITIGKTGSGADYECDGTADNVQWQAAMDEAESSNAIRAIKPIGYGYDFQYNFAAAVVLKSANAGGEMIHILGDNVVIKLANGFNGDGFISENFYSEINTNFNSYSTLGNGCIKGITIEGNSTNAVRKTTTYASTGAFPGTGQAGKLYVDRSGNNGFGVGYLWNGSSYVTTGIANSGKHWRAYANHLIKIYGYKYVFEDVYLRDASEFGLYSEQTNTDTTIFNDYATMEASLARLYVVGYNLGGINWQGPHDSAWTEVKAHTNQWATEAWYNIYVGSNGNFNGGGLVWQDVHPWGPTASYGTNLMVNGAAIRGNAYIEGSSNRAAYIRNSNVTLDIKASNSPLLVELENCFNTRLDIEVYYLFAPLSKVVKLTGTFKNSIVNVNHIDTQNIASGAKVFDVTGIGATDNVKLFARIPYNSVTPANQLAAGVTASDLSNNSQIDIVQSGINAAATTTVNKYPVGPLVVKHVSGGIDYGTLQLKNVADPSANQDVATKLYVDTAASSASAALAAGLALKVAKAGDTMTGDLVLAQGASNNNRLILNSQFATGSSGEPEVLRIFNTTPTGLNGNSAKGALAWYQADASITQSKIWVQAHDYLNYYNPMTFLPAAVNTGTGVITLAAQNEPYINAYQVQFSSTGTLPGGLSAATNYYIKRLTATTFQVYNDAALTSQVTLSTQGTGTHTITPNNDYTSTDGSIYNKHQHFSIEATKADGVTKITRFSIPYDYDITEISTFSSNLSINSGVLRIVGSNASQKQLLFGNPPTPNPRVPDGSNIRWGIQQDATTESGSNAGSDFRIARFSDTGVLQGTATLFIKRSTGFVGIGTGTAAPLGQLQVATAADQNILYINNSGASNNAGNILIESGSAASRLIQGRVTGDTVARWSLEASGKQEWGPGGGTTRDTNLYRLGVGQLQTDTQLRAGTNFVSPSTASGYKVFNTSDETTNFEQLQISVAANVFQIFTGAAGSGTTRNLRVGDASEYLEIAPNASGGAAKMTITRTSNSTASLLALAHAGMSASSGGQALLSATMTVAQSGGAGYTGFLLNVTESSTGSGSKMLIDLQVAASSKFSVDNAGQILSGAHIPLLTATYNLGSGSVRWGTLFAGSINLANATAITMADGSNMVLGTTTGTKIGTATTQKIGFYNATPIIQPTGSVITALGNLGLVASPTIASTELSDAASLQTYGKARKSVYIYDDFINLVNSPQFLSVGSGSTGFISIPDATSIGVQAINTGTGATNNQGIWSSQTGIIYFDPLAVWTFESRVRIGTNLSDGTDRYQLLSGFVDVSNGESVDGAYFSYRDDLNGGKWELVTSNNSVRTRVDSTITVAAATWYVLKVVVRDIAGTLTARFYINDVQVGGDVTTNIPNSAARAFGYGTHIVKSLGTTNRFLSVDYMEISGTFAANR